MHKTPNAANRARQGRTAETPDATGARTAVEHATLTGKLVLPNSEWADTTPRESGAKVPRQNGRAGFPARSRANLKAKQGTAKMGRDFTGTIPERAQPTASLDCGSTNGQALSPFRIPALPPVAEVRQGKTKGSGRALRLPALRYRLVTAVLLSRFDWDHHTCPSYHIPVEWLPVARLKLHATEARPMSMLAEVRGPVLRYA